MGETLRYQELSPVEVVVEEEEEEDMEEEEVASEVDAVEAATEVEDMVEVCVVVQFYPRFKFYFLLYLGMVMYDNDFETKGNKI